MAHQYFFPTINFTEVRSVICNLAIYQSHTLGPIYRFAAILLFIFLLPITYAASVMSCLLDAASTSISAPTSISIAPAPSNAALISSSDSTAQFRLEL